MKRRTDSRTPVCLVVGTRPEAIKLAPLVLAMRESKHLRPVLLSTGQHREMLDQSLASFGLRPDADLRLMRADQTLPRLTASVLTAVSTYLEKEAPAALLVQGDTTTAYATALAAFYARIPLGHVEAGLRTGDMTAPWPEEMNRRTITPLARWHFCPTQRSLENLTAERVPRESCHLTGNTVVDALLWTRSRTVALDADPIATAQALGVEEGFAANFFGQDAPWVLVTGHRRESFGKGLEDICKALLSLTQRHPKLGIIYPVHLNPRVREPVLRILGKNPRIALIEPVGYQSFVWLMARAKLVLSDSGGVQEECPSLGKPLLVMRDTTERPEGVEAGTCRLVGSDPARITAEVQLLLGDEAEYRRRSRLANPFGDGLAAQRILAVLESELALVRTAAS